MQQRTDSGVNNAIVRFYRFQNASKGRKEHERYTALMEKLQDERKKQQEHVDKIKHRLNNEKDQWFLSRSVKSAKNEAITQFLQLCLFPRYVRATCWAGATDFLIEMEFPLQFQMHIYRTRCNLLCEIRSHHSHIEDAEFFNVAVLWSCKSQIEIESQQTPNNFIYTDFHWHHIFGDVVHGKWGDAIRPLLVRHARNGDAMALECCYIWKGVCQISRICNEISRFQSSKFRVYI